MGKLVADSWLGRLGLMNATSDKKNKKKNHTCSSSIGIGIGIGVVSFEVAGLMSKALHLWHSLADGQITRLRYEVVQTEGVRKLVSDHNDFLFSLALSEFMDSLGSLVPSVARLGKRCTDPVLQRFDHVFTHLARNATPAHLFGFQYAGNKMDRKAKKMERLVGASSNLYQELEVLAELEQTLRRMKIQVKSDSDPSRRGSLADFKHKVVWQRQEVKRLRQNSLWNRTYDYTVRLLARSLFTILGRINHVFGFHTTTVTAAAALLLDGDDDDDDDKHSRAAAAAAGKLYRCHSVVGLMQSSVHPSELTRFSSGPLSAATDTTFGGQHLPHTTLPLPHPWKHRNWKKTQWQVSTSTRSLGGCMVTGADSPVLHSCMPPMDGRRLRGADAVPRRSVKGMKEQSNFQCNISNYTNLYMSFLDQSQQKPLKAPPSTLGAAALALHYANVIIVIEKLAVSPYLIGLDARDDLYSMLPSSIRAALRARLKSSCAKNLTSSFYDPILAEEWRDALSRILDWLAPLAHNMIRWQSERNFEQQHLASSANILLLQTLYFADQAKSEAAITELLVGLNYLWRFGRELNARAPIYSGVCKQQKLS